MSNSLFGEALEPLYEPWEEPNKHRVRGTKKGEPALVKDKRRPSPIELVQNLRAELRIWREGFYVGASETSRHLLAHWFARPHKCSTPSGDQYDFQYYFCQREAIETLIFLKEVRGIDRLSQLIGEFGGANRTVAALGVQDDEDAWARFAFKLATGAGKTKCMSLAIVWSYFHAVRESGSEMARHFVLIAPNITVYERLKEDFGNGAIFDADPLIPPEWRGDWNMSVVLQDETGGSSTGGVLYLTNIHRLYDYEKRRNSKDAGTYDFMGPAVSKSKALDTCEQLRRRVTSHARVMVLNDEAHHVWDPDNAWNEAISFIHRGLLNRGGGITTQLDFTATPKDDKGQTFKHVVCDTPLGEAVDAGIVKTPVIGRVEGLHERAEEDAAYRFDMHLRVGYSRWLKSRDEWKGSAKKALLFVMCEDTDSADAITQRLNTDTAFAELNGRTINLHTNLKGKVKRVGKGANARLEFVEDDKAISDEDLEKLRQLSRELDRNTSPYYCIVSVLMLREGWDVRNVTTIVPLRPFSARSGILPEQTLGRGLRRMTPPGRQGANELVSIVEHPAFAALYREQLAQEGLPIEDVDESDIPTTTVSIFPDREHKDLESLGLFIPALAAGHRVVPQLNDLSIEDARKELWKYQKQGKLKLGEKGSTELDYEGRHLITGEVVESMRIDVPLLESGVGAVSYYVRELETICRIRGLHKPLAPVLQEFIERHLFERVTSIFDPELINRLADPDVAEHIRAVFVPLIRARTTAIEERRPTGNAIALSSWRPYQVTHSERRPTLPADRTLFNLVPCHRALEEAFTSYVDGATDVVSFAKNAGPQCLRIDFIASGGRLAFYTPDFFVRLTSGRHLLVETKGREDRDVPSKARAAIAWCESASSANCPWEYLYLPQSVFARHRGSSVEELAVTCRPALVDLIGSAKTQEELPLFAYAQAKVEELEHEESLLAPEALASLPPRYRHAVDQASMLLRFLRTKDNVNYAAAFSALLGPLDEAAKGLLLRRLQEPVPAQAAEQGAWFEPDLDVRGAKRRHYEDMARNLKKTLVYGNGISPIGLLRSCLDFALNDNARLDGVFEAVRGAFRLTGGRRLLSDIERVNDFRNTRIAHQEEPLNESELAERELRHWMQTIAAITAIA